MKTVALAVERSIFNIETIYKKWKRSWHIQEHYKLCRQLIIKKTPKFESLTTTKFNWLKTDYSFSTAANQNVEHTATGEVHEM